MPWVSGHLWVPLCFQPPRSGGRPRLLCQAPAMEAWRKWVMSLMGPHASVACLGWRDGQCNLYQVPFSLITKPERTGPQACRRKRKEREGEPVCCLISNALNYEEVRTQGCEPRQSGLLNPRGALLRFPRHAAQSVTPEKEPLCEKPALLPLPCLFFFLNSPHTT